MGYDLPDASCSAVRAEMMRTKPDVLPLARKGSRAPVPLVCFALISELREAKSVLRDLDGLQAISARRQGRYAQQRGNKQKVRSALHFITNILTQPRLLPASAHPESASNQLQKVA